MTLSNWISAEWRLSIGRAASLFLFVLFSALLACAALNGKAHLDKRLESIDRHQTDIARSMSGWLKDLEQKESLGAEAEVSPRTGSAMDIRFSSHLPQRALADFSIGQSDILPYVGTVALFDPDIRMFTRYEFDDPVSLMLGAFDLSMAIIVLLPLLLIVFCFDLLSADRDAQRLGLILSQGVSIKSLFWHRLLLRSAAVVVVFMLIMLLALLLNSGAASFYERSMAFMFWAAASLLYIAFWIAVIALVVSYNRRSEFNIMAMLGIWLAFVFIVPAGASTVLETVYPTPTRLAYLAEVRQMENEARLQEADIANRFIMDHPEMLVNEDTEFPAFLRAAFLVNSTVDRATRPIQDEFEAAARQRQASVGIIRYLSPAIIIDGLFNDLAGTSSARHQRYMQQVRDYKAEFAGQVGASIVAGQPLTVAEFKAISAFSFADEPLIHVLDRHVLPLLFLTLLVIVLVILINQRLALFSVVGGNNRTGKDTATTRPQA